MSTDFEKTALPLLDDLFHAALNFTRNEPDARDLLQDTMLRALKRFEQFQTGTNFKAWIYTIMRNAYLDLCRRRKHEPIPLDLDESATPVERPPEVPMLEGLSDRLRSALDKLNPRHRLLLFLCDIEGFSYKEIAEIMGCPMGSVMSGLYNARQQLKKDLTD